MRNALYPRLAAQNLKQNRRFYVPYLLALVGLAAAFYVMSALVFDPGVHQLRGAEYVQVMMGLGMFIAGIFSAILVLYINSFLMKQRKKELGLYNILGMGKSNLALLQCWESLYTALIGIVGGIACGVILHAAATVLLTRLLRFSIPFSLGLSLPAVALTAVLFGALLVLALVINLGRVSLVSPIQLLRGGQAGEKEPKTRWLLAVLGILCLGAGYAIAITTADPMSAIVLYFLAVLLVIVGTYCLFTAGSIALLKLLRKNKGFYYQTGHFIGVSGMLYRMKRNAVGLANICILSTMVMVMISGTLSLYLGTGEIIAAQYPSDFQIEVRYAEDQEEPFDPQAAVALAEDFAREQGLAVEDLRTVEYVSFDASLDEYGGFLLATSSDRSLNRMVYLITASGYAAMSGQSAPVLEPGQAMVCGEETPLGELTFHTVEGETKSLEVTERLPELRYFSVTNDEFSPVCLVVADEQELSAWYRFQQPTADRDYRFLIFMDLDCTQEQALGLQAAWWDYTGPGGLEDNLNVGGFNSLSVDARADMEVDGYAMAGGFLFLGILLGIIFLLATALIIYYKQVSEGYEDQGRFEIMRKVGLEERQVRASIRSQVLTVFFLPILAAAIHILFDFNMVVQLLTLFAVRSVAVTALCTVGTVLVFCLVYGVVYLLTARTYYKIVK